MVAGKHAHQLDKMIGSSLEQMSADRHLSSWLAPEQEIKGLQINDKPYAYHCHVQQLHSGADSKFRPLSE